MTIVNIEKSQLMLKIAIGVLRAICCRFCEELFCLKSASALENISLTKSRIAYICSSQKSIMNSQTTRIALIISLLFSNIMFAQINDDHSDEIIDKMCSDFKSTENLRDSLRIESLNQKFIFPYLSQFPEAERENQVDYLYFRFQKRCEFFRAYLQKVDPPKNENWIRLNQKPKIMVSEKEINYLKASENFHYFEYTGEKTEVRTDHKYWTETFSDGSYSKLFYHWIDKTKFELEFIESNNHTRKNFSNKGDKYIYEIINKEGDFYWILCEIPGQSEILKFKLFVDQ
ncbi:hypothetical protein [Chryseobacterium koreense]|uniref:hypothetical protein n=1 Tax=Chryseobacterium koreense TaxID=232216 RepID=UPI0026F05F64|nr:hypothetical protein [Chryseobacterium koreense]